MLKFVTKFWSSAWAKVLPPLSRSVTEVESLASCRRLWTCARAVPFVSYRPVSPISYPIGTVIMKKILIFFRFFIDIVNRYWSKRAALTEELIIDLMWEKLKCKWMDDLEEDAGREEIASQKWQFLFFVLVLGITIRNYTLFEHLFHLIKYKVPCD